MGTPVISASKPNNTPYSIIATAETWIESEAVDQLITVTHRSDMLQAVGYPDLHPGKGVPIGACFITQSQLYPDLIGNDIGCGMALFALDIPARKTKLDKWLKRLNLEWDDAFNPHPILKAFGLRSNRWNAALGTIGGGNHFAELQTIEAFANPDLAAAYGLDKELLYLLVHSGSRGRGQALLQQHLKDFGVKGVVAESEAGQAYLKEHDRCVTWAKANRYAIASRFAEQIGAEITPVFDLCHNFVALQQEDGHVCWLHRKGAAPAERGTLAPIPGSRGAFTYLVQPLTNANWAAAGWSLAHGAGRKWQRGKAKARLDQHHTRESLKRTKLGGHVLCEDSTLLYDEAPEAYKSVEQTVEALEAATLVERVAIMRPLLTYKTRRQHIHEASKGKHPKKRGQRR